jgi:rsbT antagonist protein RsbS
MLFACFRFKDGVGNYKPQGYRKSNNLKGCFMANINISVIKVRDILMVTVPSDPDDPTIVALQDNVLKNMEQYNAKALILDISAVEIFDSFFARTLTETALMVKLMGGRTIIAGMRPSVAVTATELGLDLGQVEAALNVDMALDKVSDI